MDFEALERAIRDEAHADVVELVTRDILAPIAAGTSSLLAIKHPLGFTCLPVYRVDTLGACVHVWPRKRRVPRATTSPFHCHSWDLLSHVLHGQVGNQLVEVSDGSSYRAFEVRGIGPVDHLVATDRTVDARGLKPEYWNAGQTYTLEAGLFHASTMAADTAAVTMVLGFHAPGRPDITLGSLDTPDHFVTRRPYDSRQTALLAQRTIARLKRTVGAGSTRALVGVGG